MENNEQLNGPPRPLVVRSGRMLPEVNSFDESGNSYMIEAGDRPQDSEGLLKYWHTLVRHKVAIASASFAGLVLGFLVGIPMKPVYRASTTLEVLNVNEDFMNMKMTQASVPGADSDNLSEEETQSTLLQSSELLDRVIEKMDPNPTPPAHLATQGWRKWLRLVEEAPETKPYRE